MTEEKVASQETEEQKTEETAQGGEETKEEQSSSAEDLFEELPVDDEDDFDEQLEENEPDEGDTEDELDEDKRTKDYWKKRADFYEKKARKVDSIEAVEKAVKKYGITNQVVIDDLKTMVKKGRRQNEIYERAKSANKVINAERSNLKAQIEKQFGSIENLKAQVEQEAKTEVATSWGTPDVGNKAPDTMVDWEQVKDLPVSERLKAADKLKPIDRGWIGNRPPKKK